MDNRLTTQPQNRGFSMSNLTDHPWDHINPAGFPTPQLPNRGYRVWLALVVMVISSGLFVAARITARIATHQMGSDDYVILAAMASFIVQTTLWAMSVRTGYGAVYLKLNTHFRQEFNKWWFLGSIFYLLTIMLYKTSVILLLKRIFVQEKFQKACWFVLTVNICWGLGNVLGWLFQCLPIPAMWGVVPPTRCFNLQGLWISLAAYDVSTDVVILAMPVPMVWTLNLKVRHKIMITGLFFLGAVVVVFSLMSCSAIASSLQHFGEANKYTFALANLFSVLESGMGIIGACIPIMRQPLARMLSSCFKNRYPESYMLEEFSKRHKDGSNISWHSVSATGPDRFNASDPHGSDELGIVEEAGDLENAGGRGTRIGVCDGPEIAHPGIWQDVTYGIQQNQSAHEAMSDDLE